MSGTIATVAPPIPIIVFTKLSNILAITARKPIIGATNDMKPSNALSINATNGVSPSAVNMNGVNIMATATGNVIGTAIDSFSKMSAKNRGAILRAPCRSFDGKKLAWILSACQLECALAKKRCYPH